MATNELSIGNDINKRQTINLVNLTLTVSKRKILFIFDNVKNADDIKELIINLPNNVQTIITTKNTTLKHNFEFGNESNLEMKPFNKTECIEYIIKWNKKRRFNQFEAEKIIDLIKRNKKEISIFLLAKVMELLQTKSWTIERFEKKMEYEMTEAKAAEYILKELIDTSPNGWKLLQHCIYLDENFISMDMLEEILTKVPNNTLDIDEAKAALEELSLVNQIQLENGKESMFGIKIHSIIKDTIEIYIRKEENNEQMKILDNVIDAVNKKMPEIDEMPNQNGDWDTAEIYYRHAHKLINLKLEQEFQSNEKLADLYSKIAKYEQYKLCNLENLIKYHTNNLKILKNIHKGNNLDVARSLGNVGYSYSKLENPDEGLKYSTQALEMYRALYEGYHKDVAKSLCDVGYNYNRLKESKQALECFIEALKIYTHVYHQYNHPDVALSLNSISVTYNKLGDEQNGLENYKEGLEYSTQALKTCQSFKDKHPHVLAKVLASVGTSYNKLGDAHNGLKYSEQALEYYKQALEYTEKALKVYQDLYKDNHPHVARLLGDVGYSYNKLGDAHNGLKYSEQALEMYTNLYKNNHFDIAKSLGRVGYSYDKLGDLQKALKYYEQALEIYQHLYKGNDKRVVKSLMTVAFCYKKLGNVQKFQELKEQAERNS
ncbi:unnamed protein product [Didymodactylos carnosus]|uniref:Uncharacterized protein n=1 Tax=Didymodactylos carnosus TaxID=1234261 RepID=A0A8S2LWR3_9BILA|nr:unnamed protein product [Didymodactylos carnosus]CAF3926937.1 unnamed protein product [Didymodactylos carnosus]